MDNESAKSIALTRGISEAVDRMGIETAVEAAIDLYDELLRENDAPTPFPPAPPPPDVPSTGSSFKVFEDINYRGRPNLQNLGMLPLKIHYESAFFEDKRRAGDGDFTLPPTGRIVNAARASSRYSCIDIERWWGFSDNDLDDLAAPAYEHVAEIYDDALDKSKKFGFYSTIPIRSLNKIEGVKRMRWMDTNNRLRGLGNIVDMTFPSLYNLVDDDSRWFDFATANILEAKRIAPGKPCYPFLWPEYHPNAKAKKGQAVPAGMFRRQLEHLRERADGVVIWTLSKTKNVDFKNIPAWWGELIDFMDTL